MANAMLAGRAYYQKPSLKKMDNFFLPLTLSTAFEWKEDFRAKCKVFGDKGEECYLNERIDKPAPMKRTHVIENVFDDEQNRIVKRRVAWGKRHDKIFEQDTTTWKKEEQERQSLGKLLYAYLYECMDPDTLRKVRLHSDEYKEAEASCDPLLLYRLMLNVCEQYSANNLSAMETKVTTSTLARAKANVRRKALWTSGRSPTSARARRPSSASLRTCSRTRSAFLL